MAITRVSTVSIEELTGPKRRLDLIGAALPKQGASWGGKLIQSTTWNPGNASDAVQHVLAPIELPSEWSGVWNTTRLVSLPAKFINGEGASAQPVALASSLRDVFELIVRSGQRLRVTWTEGATELGFRKLMREGLCAQWSFSHARMDDIEWSCSWEWAGRGPGKAPTSPDLGNDKSASSLKKANQMLADYLSETTQQQAVADRTDVPGSASTFTLGQLEAIADIPRDYAKRFTQFATLISTRIQDFARIITKGASIPTLAASTVLDIATIAVQGCAQAADQMGRDMPDAWNNVEGDAAALISAASFFDLHQGTSESLLGAFAQIREEARRRRSGVDPAQGASDSPLGGQVMAIIIAKGESFVQLSVKYYASPDLGDFIALANGFAEYEVAPPVGRTLVIPVVSNQTQSKQI